MQLIKQLRQASGAPMADCKNAVMATASLEEAFEWLRKKGLSRAAKMADRVAEQGLVALRVNASRTLGCIVEVRSETDFVARNELFQARLRFSPLEAAEGGTLPTQASLTTKAAEVDAEALRELSLEAKDGTKRSTADAAVALSATVGEKVTLRRAAIVGSRDSLVAGYTHNTLATGLGSHAALVAVRSLSGASLADIQSMAEAAKRVAMHVVAAKPSYLDGSCVPEADLDAERAILQEQVASMNKPENIVAKILGSKLDKFVAERSLSTQLSVVDEGKRTIAKILKDDFGLELESYALLVAGKG
ncbi:hypothetical protein CTAYLR_006650 [Chrysophaeum taylorii]|uniref:Elongation factor Ts, mitochondrial n=1 Tax=Chrysophaeum taylorii TaxID=2483200 RepID=A0AAD7XSP8_9STRA|nr:hypothetical protein CTAYLR_006650 [Chrysophaeum taylorii]